MSALFEELDYCPAPIGALSLRRRRDPRLGGVFEIMLGQEFLMTSAFTESEIALARLGMAANRSPAADVVVGGLGLGYTAQAVLDQENAASLIVVEFLEPVIGWHREDLLPLGADLCGDDRCRFVHGDFFAMDEGDDGFDPDAPGRRFDAILVDIDHSPDALLDRGSRFHRATAAHTPGAAGGAHGLSAQKAQGPRPRFPDRDRHRARPVRAAGRGPDHRRRQQAVLRRRDPRGRRGLGPYR